MDIFSLKIGLNGRQQMVLYFYDICLIFYPLYNLLLLCDLSETPFLVTE